MFLRNPEGTVAKPKGHGCRVPHIWFHTKGRGGYTTSPLNVSKGKEGKASDFLLLFAEWAGQKLLAS